MLSFSPTHGPFPLQDDLPLSHYKDTHGPNSITDTRQMFQHDGSPSKHQTNNRPWEETDHYPEDVQADQQQRAAALGPPGSPHGVKSDSQEQRVDRLGVLENKLEEMARMLDMVKAQVIIRARKCYFFKSIKPNTIFFSCSVPESRSTNPCKLPGGM